MSDICVDNFLMPIEERYYGKSKDLLELERIIGEWRDKYKTTDPYKLTSTATAKMGTDPLVKTIAEKIKTIFGIHTLSFLVLPSASTTASCVQLKRRFPDLKSDPKLMITYTKNGPKFKPEAHMGAILIMHTGVMANAYFTDEEAMSIILHEIGHMFQHYIISNGDSIDIIKDLITTLGDIADTCISSIKNTGKPKFVTGAIVDSILIKLLLETGFIIEFYDLFIAVNPQYFEKFGIHNLDDAINYCKDRADDLIKYVDQSKYKNILNAILKISTKIKRIKGRFLTPFRTVLELLADSKEYLNQYIKRLCDKLSKYGFKNAASILPNLKYADEKIADSFASDLGYGNSLLSAMNKLNTRNLINYDPDHAPIFKPLNDICNIPFELVTYATNEHPLDGGRILNVYDDLCKDLEQGFFDPKQKADLEADIAEMKKSIDKIKSIENVITDPENESSFAYKLILKLTIDTKGGLKYNASKKLPIGFTSDPDINTAKELEYQNALRHGDVE